MTAANLSSGLLTGVLLAGAVWSGAGAQTATPAMPQEGTVYSTHSPEVGGCPALDWHVWVGPKNTLTGMVATEGMKNVWRVNGALEPNRKFHLDGQELGGALRTGTVDGEMRADGSLVATLGNISGPSACNNKTIYIRWFRRGNNPYDPNEAPGSEGSG